MTHALTLLHPTFNELPSNIVLAAYREQIQTNYLPLLPTKAIPPEFDIQNLLK